MAGSQDKPLMSWMYDGPKSLVNHEDYLLGRKMDKNFELFGNEDLQPKKATGGLSSVLEKSPRRSSAGESSLLCLDTVKKEDPLVAIKVKEEKIRREIVQNPVRMKRLQKLIMATMEKKMSKALADSSSDSSDSSADRKKSKKKKRNREKTVKRPRSRSPKRSRPRDYERDQPRQRVSHSSSYRGNRRDSDRNEYSRRDNKRRESSPQNRKDHRRSVDHHGDDRIRAKDETKRERELEQKRDAKRGVRIRHDSSESGEQSPHRTDPKTFLTVSSKASVEYSDSDSENERKRQKYSGYGLVGVKKSVTASQSRSKEKEPYWKNLKKRSPSPVSRKVPERKRQLTEEEMEERRNEMMQNAQWRNDQRDKNLKSHAKREKAEEEKEKREKGAASDFIRPMLAQVAETGTVESRIKSKLGSVQRKHGDMDSHFARK